MFEAAFKNIDNTLWKDADCKSELVYIEQRWQVFFLKYLDNHETDKAIQQWLNHLEVGPLFIEPGSPSGKAVIMSRLMGNSETNY